MQGSSQKSYRSRPVRVCRAAALATIVAVFLTCSQKQEEVKPVTDDKSPARVTLVVGSAFVINKAEKPKPKWRKIRVGTPIHVNDIVRTGKESKVDIAITGDKKITLSENTLVTIKFDMERPAEELQVVLAFGQLFGNIRKITDNRSNRNNFSTPTATATIRGTVFEIVVSRITGESSVRVVKGVVAVRKRTTSKNLWKGDPSKKTELQQVDLSNTESLAAFLGAIGFDQSDQKSAQLEKRITLANENLRAEAVKRGYSPQEIEMMVLKQSQKMREKSGEAEPQEVLIQAGHQAKISYERSGITVSQLGAKELGFLFRLYGEERLREVLSNADIVNRPAGMAAPQDSISMLMAKMIETHVKNKAMEVKEKKTGRNTPPAITSQAPLEAYVDNPYRYQIVAADPDNDDITYTLISAPQGMEISSLSGLINWVPQAPGVFPIKVRIDDGRKGTILEEFTLNVQRMGGTRLEVKPTTGTVETKFRFACTVPDSLAGDFTYRWDFEDDGKWDLPAGGAFSKDRTASFIYRKRSQYEPRVEIRNSQGISQFLSAKILVAGRPCKVNAGNDQQGNLLSRISLVGRVVDPDGEMLSCSWDFDSDGKADWEGKLPQAVTHAFGKAGRHSAVFSVRTFSGKTFSDTATVVIINAPVVASTRKEFKTLVGMKVTFEGKGSDPDGTIKEYEWDFNSDGTYDWRSNLLGNSTYTYAKAGTYKAVFRVTSEDGGQATDTLKVTVFDQNSPEFNDFLKTKER